MQVSVPLPGFYLLKVNPRERVRERRVDQVSVPLPGFYLLKVNPRERV